MWTKQKKGWYIKYIDRDPDILAQQEAVKKKEKMDMDDDMRNRERIQKMIAALQENPSLSERDENEEEEYFSSEETTEKKETLSETDKVQFKLVSPLPPVLTTSVSVSVLPKKISFLNDSDPDPIKPEEPNEKKRKNSDISDPNQSHKKLRKTESKSALEELTTTIKKRQTQREENDLKKKIEKQQKEKEEQQSLPLTNTPQISDNWLIPGLIVKVMNKKVGDGSYYGKKGTVVGVADLYVGIIQMLDSNKKLRVDQAHLETVIPAIGSDIAIVIGEHQGKVGILEEVNVDNYKAIVRVDDTIIQKDYEHVCKISDVNDI